MAAVVCLRKCHSGGSVETNAIPSTVRGTALTIDQRNNGTSEIVSRKIYQLF